MRHSCVVAPDYLVKEIHNRSRHYQRFSVGRIAGQATSHTEGATAVCRNVRSTTTKVCT